MQEISSSYLRERNDEECRFKGSRSWGLERVMGPRGSRRPDKDPMDVLDFLYSLTLFS